MFNYIDPALKQLREDAKEAEERLNSLKLSMSTMDRTLIDPDLDRRNKESIRLLEQQLTRINAKLEWAEDIQSVLNQTA